MYIVEITYNQPIEQVEALQQAHIDWLKKYFAEGIFVAAGRKVPRTGGMIFARSMDRAELETILAGDPFTAVAAYTITEFVPTLTSDALAALTEQ